jgi:putative transposase
MWEYTFHMVLYRREPVRGGTYFFTVTLRDRRSSLLIDHIDALREAYAHTHKQRPFKTIAICVLPDHLHVVWTLPPGDDDFAQRWALIKGRFVRSIEQAGAIITRNKRGEADIWQSRFWEHTIRDERDLENHIAYIHHNPVKHGLAPHAVDWPHSSFHRFVARGELAADWAAPPIEIPVIND